MADENGKNDESLGLNQPICRRDFLNSTLLAAGGALLGALTPQQLLATASDEWTGYGGIGDYASSNGNTLEVMNGGHQIRDGIFESLPSDTIDTGEVFDCVVVVQCPLNRLIAIARGIHDNCLLCGYCLSRCDRPIQTDARCNK